MYIPPQNKEKKFKDIIEGGAKDTYGEVLTTNPSF